MAAGPMRRLLLAAIAVVVAGCATGGSSRTASSNTPDATPTASGAATGTGVPTATALPGGLEPRRGVAALVNGEAAACVPRCGVGRVADGPLPAGRYQTGWFFGGYMTIETDGTWTLGEDSNAELSLPTVDGYQVAFGLDPQLVLHGIVADDVPLEAGAYAD